MDDMLPLPTLLSAALVAFTIEFDNEFEHRMVHRTTTGWPPARAQGGPWPVSPEISPLFRGLVPIPTAGGHPSPRP